MYNQSDAIEKGVMISVSLLKRQNLASFSTLKNLLTFIPNPLDIQEVWRRSICEVMNTSPQTCYWLFQNPDCLKPEINVRDIIIEELSKKLLSWGLSSEDFRFNSEGQLEIEPEIEIKIINSRQAAAEETILTLIYFLLV